MRISRNLKEVVQFIIQNCCKKSCKYKIISYNLYNFIVFYRNNCYNQAENSDFTNSLLTHRQSLNLYHGAESFPPIRTGPFFNKGQNDIKFASGVYVSHVCQR